MIVVAIGKMSYDVLKPESSHVDSRPVGLTSAILDARD